MKKDKPTIKPLSKKEKEILDKAVKMIVRDYGETIKRLAKV